VVRIAVLRRHAGVCVHDLQVRVAPRIDFQVNILPAQAQQLRTAKTQVQGDD
jgi:hypothetical protein